MLTTQNSHSFSMFRICGVKKHVICCDKATSSYISPVRMNRAVAPSPVQFQLIYLLLSLSHIAYIYIHACIPAGLITACFPSLCVRPACSSREHPSDAIRRCHSQYIPPYSDDLVESDQIIRLGRRIFPYSSTLAK
jgi:hypothetical protein